MNPELDKLIKAALADGVLTDKEREILIQKAKKLGIDEDEFQIELETRRVAKNSKEPDTNKELDELVEAALADNKLTGKEMEVLINKAKKLGIDENEFEIKLKARKTHLIKKKREKSLSYVRDNIRVILIVSGALILTVSLFVLITLTSKNHKIKRFAKKNDLEYTSVSDALVNYDFNNAYKLVSFFNEISYKKAGNLSNLFGKIVDTEVNYLFSEGQISRAFQVAGENMVESEWERDKGISETELDEITSNNYSILISKGMYNEALQLLISSKQLQTNEKVDQLFYEVVNSNNNGAFSYGKLLEIYSPIQKFKTVGTKKVKKFTANVYEEKVVTNWRGKPQEDKYGRVLKEKVLVKEGGQPYWDEVPIRKEYFDNSHRENAQTILKEKQIEY